MQRLIYRVKTGRTFNDFTLHLEKWENEDGIEVWKLSVESVHCGRFVAEHEISYRSGLDLFEMFTSARDPLWDTRKWWDALFR